MEINVGKVYIQRRPAAGEIECCDQCAKLRQAEPELTPEQITAAHLIHGTPVWEEIGYLTEPIELKGPPAGRDRFA